MNNEEFIKIIKKYGEIKSVQEAFEKYPVEEEEHKGRLEAYWAVSEEVERYNYKYKIGDIGYSGNHSNKDSAISSSELHRNETNYFPVRFIEESKLAETLNDPILKNKFYSPIIVMTNDNVLELYIDTFKQNDVNRYFLINNYIPYKLRMSYIKKPAKVLYGEDVNLTNVDCDLPESLHVDVVKHATDLYRIALFNGRYNQQNQQEIAKQNRT